MSRFQLLIFTFVISSCLFILTVCEHKFPEVHNDILALLGISSGSYIGAKAIQTTKDTILEKIRSKPPPPTQTPPKTTEAPSKTTSEATNA